MFGPIYDGGTPFERCKYGCLNVSMNDKGCSTAESYGEAYFILRNETVRWRVTITDMDSMNEGAACGTLSKCCHVLLTFQQQELKSLMDIATGRVKLGEGQFFFTVCWRCGVCPNLVKKRLFENVVSRSAIKQFLCSLLH